MASVQRAKATLDDLYRTPEKAELIGGKIVTFMATRRKPNRVAFRIRRSLGDHAAQILSGEAYTDNMGFAIPVLPSERESFSPDASYHRRPFPRDAMRFINGAPHFAVEVRSDNDYTPAAELEMAEKRADYFLAGTEVVWDVDTIAESIYLYRAVDPEHPVTFHRGDTANAEPAVPGWRIDVDWIFS